MSATKKTAATKSAATKSNKTAVNKKAARSIENAMHTAQPGIIGFIMCKLLEARDKQKPLTANELLAKLSAKFPERPVSGMFVTVRAQLSRLPNERDFSIDKTRDGKYVYYSAAKGAQLPIGTK